MRAKFTVGKGSQGGFTIIEMLVVILIIVVLIAIVLAVGEQVRVKARLAVTHTELRNLQAALLKLHHQTNTYPVDMAHFLVAYQQMHAYGITGGATWQQHPNIITQLPATATVMGNIPAPGGTATMIGVVEVLDGFGNPIQYMPPTQPSVSNAFYPVAGQSYTVDSTIIMPLTTTPAPPIPPVFVPSGITSGGSPPSATSAEPAAAPHAPYFYSFGVDGPAGAIANINNSPTAQYIYSYEP
ncbi:MAG: prepilin-type N-terminal cleavage/methylation domain-containing protein [Phycisphaerales bacterium]|nr:prepilin-type N-terminal cleavage/methylation domain-containing protein [Phycisphaerales bacterium]